MNVMKDYNEMALSSEQASYWVKELSDNLAVFRKKSRMNTDSKLEFISEQYNTLFLLVRVLRGESILAGFPFRLLDDSKDEE